MKPLLNVIHTAGKPIIEQLQWEEAILRADDRNWCIINEGTPPAIVLGISGKVDQHVSMQNTLPLIRRFSGGGTVVVNEHTVFVTFIFNETESGTACCPKNVMQWAADFHQPLFDPHPFRLRENDFVLGEKKCGGNAQYMCKGRWLHHTSFLWDYDPKQMAMLSHPPKMPDYRQNRPHEDFVCRAGDYISQKIYMQKLRCRLEDLYVVIQHTDIAEIMLKPHRKATNFLD